MRELLNKIFGQSEFVQNVLKLFSSTVVANAIRAGALVIITRLYTGSDIGEFQTFFSISLIIGIVASLKYELAIVLPKEDADADHLVVLSFLTLLLVTALSTLGIFFFQDDLLHLLNAIALKQYSFLLIPAIFLLGMLQICRFLLIRYKRFNDLALNKLYQSALHQGVTLSWGAVAPSFVGLFYGYIAGLCVPVWLVLRHRLFSVKYVRWSRMKELMGQYKKFPLINTGSVFLNNFSLELPVFMFAAYYDPTVVGIYAIANQAMVMPVNLIGTSVQQVYFQAASEAYNDHPGKILPVYLTTLKRLFLLGGGLIGLIALFAPFLAGKIFGEAFAASGLYMAIISPAIFFRFLSSPIGATYSVINRQEVQIILIGASVIFRFGAMYLFRENVFHMLWALSISTALFYAVYNFWLYRLLKKLAADMPDSA
ncbi:MAG: lipopolysaccharide biosynthesis protein [Calditrichota bacterium]